MEDGDILGEGGEHVYLSFVLLLSSSDLYSILQQSHRYAYGCLTVL